MFPKRTTNNHTEVCAAAPVKRNGISPRERLTKYFGTERITGLRTLGNRISRELCPAAWFSREEPYLTTVCCRALKSILSEAKCHANVFC